MEAPMQTWRDATRTEQRQYQLIASIFFKHPKLLEFFFQKRSAQMQFSPENMLKEMRCFSSGEQVLIRVAMDVWSGSGNAKVWQLLEKLDHENFSNVLKVLDNWRHYMSAN
jgi:hypothetical protein